MAALSEAITLYIDDHIARVRRDLKEELDAFVEGQHRAGRLISGSDRSMTGDQLGAFLQGLAVGSIGVFVLLRYFVK